MLNQADIDSLMQTIQSNNPAYVYYVAHMIEGRETNILDEHMYKDVSKFKVIKIRVDAIENAYFEYKNYIENHDNYHIENEECYYTPTAKYIHYFVVPNGKKNYTLDINPRIPSIIYGYKRKVYIDDQIHDVLEPSPIKEVYTNAPEFGTMTKSQVFDALNGGKLDWKYLKLKEPAIVDGIEYNYITSDWYILTFHNYPMIEKPLINVRQHSGYFIDIQDAFRYIEQLIS